MTIPPFPSQDLAKLVLGYLAEEQLMTAYDEFLQASPYLDALGNEYDRIFMTSLKNILAEYRAVKIYVETCKPFVLRKKIFQCTNLLEMVKFLVQNVDINKIQMPENNNSTKYSSEKQSNFATVKANICDVCSSLKLESCTCKIKSNTPIVPHTQISTSSLESSVETTALSDLPGNHITCRKKSGRMLNKDCSEFDAIIDLNESSIKLSTNNEVTHKTIPNNSNDNLLQAKVNQDVVQNINVSEKSDSLEMRQKEEFNSILNQVCNKNTHIDKHNNCNFEDINKQTRASMTGYDEFATGVKSGGNERGVSVPDSSTSENLHVQIPAAKDTNKLVNLEKNAKVTQTKTQYLLKVANVKNNIAIQPNEVVSISTVNTCTLPRTKSKPDESKIKIISDIKVDQPFNNSEGTGANVPKMPSVLKNATSTPLLQMQTIFINGTPVYKHKPFGQKHNYTKDEIMAMPTIILAPAPGSSQISVSQPSEVSHSSTSQYVPAIVTSSARSLGPLVIDVTSSNNTSGNHVTNAEKQTKSPVSRKEEESVPKDDISTKVLDITSASAPKDNTVTGNPETSTPQVFPPLRKSSSTPRRTSHVRVLDFTTPRRILHETINKCVSHMALDSDNEVVLSKSPNVPVTSNTENVIKNTKLDDSNGRSLKENGAKKIKNWDADLRVLATVPERDISVDITPSPKPKPKPKSTRKSKSLKTQPPKKGDKPVLDKSSIKKKTPKVKLPKNKTTEEEVEIINVSDNKSDVPVKPTINIIAGDDRNPNTSSEINKSQSKSNNEDHIDTPEMERISLQNEIGVKLNISDLLETPYKQALYDIQMETPRFLGPDIPDDPLSDIKIMNIPTPRFLNTATPSSYSSRPTDYSSGGSYYKPEDQDYMRVHDDLDCPVTSTKETGPNDLSNKDSDDSKEKENMKPSRPVRECTKNVSYNLTRSKYAADNRGDMDSSIDSTGEKGLEKLITNTSVTPKVKDSKHKSDMSKKGSSKKRKTPVKKEMMKSFMKIKPRRPTPTKTARGKRKTIDPEAESKVQTRKKSSNKEGCVSTTPLNNCAPTKSRRKSSTPRKLHCSKSFHSESSGHDSPEFVSKSKDTLPEPSLAIPDSDTEQLPLRWSDDGSQEPQPVVISIPNETEDIKKIKEYIETSFDPQQRVIKEEVSLHIDLVKRGFDLETAKIIERDLLDTPPHPRLESAESDNLILTAPTAPIETRHLVQAENKVNNELEKTLESDCSTTNNLQIVQNDDEEVDEEIELSVHECNEESANYFTCSHDASKSTSTTNIVKLKDKFSMEVCIDDGVSIRLRATPFSLLHDQDPQTVEYFNYSYQETEMAVSSISNIDKLYTPMKESIKAQCYEIFDSTLTSLDTPLKAKSPHKTETEVSVTEIVLEVEPIEERDKIETKKRKRDVTDDGATDSKKLKPEAQLLFNSTNIQNFDIDSVLSKLHGP